MGRRRIPIDLVKLQAMRDRGMSIREIAEEMKVSKNAILYALDPEKRACQAERDFEKRIKREGRQYVPVEFYKAKEKEVFPPLPPDTRDLTGRLLGDPLPERSALYKIRSQQSA